MFNDKVNQAIADRGLGSFQIIGEPKQPEPLGPEAQKLERLGRMYRDRGNMLDNRAAVEHGYKRTIQLRREARVCHDLADSYFEEVKVLSHYGRPGMKWGIRRSKKQLGADTKSGTSDKKLKKKAEKLSDTELKARVARMNLEKQYIKLNKEANAKTKSRIQRGAEEMARISKKAVTKAVQDQADTYAKDAVKKAIKEVQRRRGIT